jgi:hypothetical protein
MPTALYEVRRIVSLLAMGRPLERGMCSQWTSRHWEIVLSENLGPWFHKCLCDRVDVGINSDVLNRLRRDYRSSAIANLYREVALRNLLAVFNSRCIATILLKGAYLGRFVYKDPSLRPMLDIDILVSEDHFEQAGQELERLKYKLVFEPKEYEESLLKLPKVYGLSAPVTQFVDLHRGIQSMDYYRFPSSILWGDAVQREFCGHRVFYLSAELNFIHLVIHALNHRAGLRDWLDLIALIRSTNLDWERLIVLARSLGAMRPLFWAFDELERIWGAPPPEHVSAALALYVPNWIEDRVIRSRYCYLWRLFARVARLGGWRPRFRYVATKLAMPSDEWGLERISSNISRLKSKIRLFLHFWKRPTG